MSQAKQIKPSACVFIRGKGGAYSLHEKSEKLLTLINKRGFSKSAAQHWSATYGIQIFESKDAARAAMGRS